jgi:hypothetical protein
LDAEKAGANVTDIMNQFNYATEVLAKADNSYRVGNLNQAAVQSDSVLPIAQLVTVSAQNAKQTALAFVKNDFWSTIVLTVIGTILFIVALFLVWRWFKRRYIIDFSQLKPEVPVDEA